MSKTLLTPEKKVKLVDFLAATQSEGGKAWRTNGNITEASRMFGVSIDSIKRFISTDRGIEMLDAAKARLDELRTNTVLDNSGLTFVEKLARIQDIAADRLLKEAHAIPLDKIASAIRDITHTKQLVSEKPTEIVEYLAGLTPAERAEEMRRAERDLEHAKEEARVGVVSREDPAAS